MENTNVHSIFDSHLYPLGSPSEQLCNPGHTQPPFSSRARCPANRSPRGIQAKPALPRISTSALVTTLARRQYPRSRVIVKSAPAASDPRPGAATPCAMAQIFAPERFINRIRSSQTLDPGAGYTLRDGQIFAPETDRQIRSAASRPDLGAGYTLRDGQIFAPEAISNQHPLRPRPSTSAPANTCATAKFFRSGPPRSG